MDREETGVQHEQRADRVRRALLRAAWLVPVALAVKIPLDAFAQYKDPGKIKTKK